LDQLVDHLFIFEGDGKIVDYHSNYTDYKLTQDAKERQLKVNKVNEKKVNKKGVEKPISKKKLTYHEKKEYDGLMDEIDALEKEKILIEGKIGSGNTAYEELQKLSSRIGAVIETIDEKTYRWMELDEYV
jgi:ATP-binding cassette subfamily F protein uup